MHNPAEGPSRSVSPGAGLSRDPNATSLLEEVAADFTRQKPGGVFVVLSGPDRGEQVILEERQITIGSAPSCDLVLSDRTVSRRHVTVSLESEQAYQEAVRKR